MTSTMRRLLVLSPIALSVGWLFVDAPGPVLREGWFVLVMLTLTLATRTVTWSETIFALSLGIGLVAPLMILVGWTLAKAGLDVSVSELGSWAVVPVIEELLKLVPVFIAAALYRRRTKLELNPSDWLLLGCAAGAGFAMVENAQLVRHDAGILRDMARQYGPSWLVPGAWGVTGFVGHAAATGMAAAGIGLARAARRHAAIGLAPPALARVALLVPIGWVTLEHVLANHRVNTGSEAALWFGNGRLTPWLFLAVVAVVVVIDFDRARRMLAHSRTFRVRVAMIRAALLGGRPANARPRGQLAVMAAREARLVNAAAWMTLEAVWHHSTAAEETTR